MATAIATAVAVIGTKRSRDALQFESEGDALLKTDDYRGAMGAYDRAAALGNRRAARMIGYLYATSPAPLHSRSRAVHWFRNAKAPLAEEEFFVGQAYLDGENLSDCPNLGEALWWFRASAYDGYGPAIELMKQPPTELPPSARYPCKRT